VEAAVESPGAERLVARVIDSRLADESVKLLLASPDLWRIVEEVAASPAVTDAVTQQGAGFADEVATQVRGRTRRFDSWLERRSRRLVGRGTELDGPEPAPGAP
jgi:hypothetical protein